MKSILDFLPDHTRKGSNEYAGPCPWCGGTDRFVVWPNQGKGGRFLCRQCQKKGDVIDYLRNGGLSYREALEALGLESSAGTQHGRSVGRLETVAVEVSHEARQARIASAQWITAATSFVENSLEQGETAFDDWQNTLRSKRIKMDTARKFKIGWNPFDQYPFCQEWGLDGNKLRLPRGLIVPTSRGVGVVSFKIRCADVSTGPRYWQVKGGGSECL